MYDCFTRLIRLQSSWGQHGTHLGPAGPRWAPCCPHEPCYLGMYKNMGFIPIQANPTRILRRKYLTPSQPSVTGDNLNISCKRTGFSLRAGVMFCSRNCSTLGSRYKTTKTCPTQHCSDEGRRFATIWSQNYHRIPRQFAKHGVVHSEQAEEYNP